MKSVGLLDRCLGSVHIRFLFREDIYKKGNRVSYRR